MFITSTVFLTNGFNNSGYPENLGLFLEQKTAVFYQQQILGYPQNNSSKVDPALTSRKQNRPLLCYRNIETLIIGCRNSL